MTVRRIALGLVVAALVAVSALGVVAAVLERRGAPAGSREAQARAATRDAVRHETQVDAPPRASRGEGWRRVAAGAASYAVPPGWSRPSMEKRVAYGEDGVVIASGRAYAVAVVSGCPVAWAVLADPVRSSNATGVVRATALAWARGYAGLPDHALPEVTTDGLQARVEVPLGTARGCAGARAELTAVARPLGDEVVVLVVARYLDVPGAPLDAAYEGVLGSLTVG